MTEKIHAFIFALIIALLLSLAAYLYLKREAHSPTSKENEIEYKRVVCEYKCARVKYYTYNYCMSVCIHERQTYRASIETKSEPQL